MLRNWCAPLVLACGLFLLSSPAGAQVVGATGAAYHDDSATDLLVVRTFIRAAGEGWRPTAALDAYLMSYSGPIYNSGHMVGGLTPAFGGAYVRENSAVSARIGYTFINTPNPRAGRTTLYVPLDRGIMTAVDLQHRGELPRLEGLVNYHWGPGMLLSEGSAHVPVSRLHRATIEGGLTGTWQSTSDEYRTWLAGPSLRLVQDGSAFGISAGLRRSGTDSGNRSFLRIGGSYAPHFRG